MVRYFVTFDADGYVAGFFPSDVHPIAPAGAVEITAAQYGVMVRSSWMFKLVNGSIVGVNPGKPRPGPLPIASS